MPEDQFEECPACSGPLNLLGTLGSLAHFRCRNCGMMSTGTEISPYPEIDNDATEQA